MRPSGKVFHEPVSVICLAGQIVVVRGYDEGQPSLRLQLQEKLPDHLARLGVEVALECAGAPETLQWCVGMLRRGGRCAVVGIPLSGVALPIQKMVLDELEVVGVRASAGEMSQVIPLVVDGRIRVGALITHRYALRDFAEAYRVFTERVDGALKVIVQP